MAYYFMAENKRGEFHPINISNSKYFQDITRRFKRPCAYSLEEIDRFTMMFDSEIELREKLVEEGVLSFKFFEKPLSIRYSINGEYIKVPNDFLYQDDLEYIYDPPRLVKHILKRYYDNDFLLIKRIINKFSDYRRCSSTIPEIRQFIEISIREGRRCSFLDEIDENGDNLIIRLIKLIILESYDNYKTGKVVYKDKLNYRNLHDLIALINSYDECLEKENSESQIDKTSEIQISEKEEEKIAQIENIQEETTIKEIIEPKPTFVRTKTLGRKKHTLDNQMGFKI